MNRDALESDGPAFQHVSGNWSGGLKILVLSMAMAVVDCTDQASARCLAVRRAQYDATSHKQDHLRPRRARGEQCASLPAETVYHRMVCSGAAFGPGARQTLTWTPHPKESTSSWSVVAEVSANAVWRRGRLFFRCDRCGNRATRLYVPNIGREPRCRRCWGLSYRSQSWSS